MHSPITISGLLYTSVITVRSFITAALLCNETIDVAGDSLPDISKLLLILISTVKGFQLALFLKNLKVLFF
jgi:hypothetical protein